MDHEESVTTGSGLDAPCREIRFALVLNGGVSLAVWMGGVTHELNCLRLAAAGMRSTGKDGRVLEAWANILERKSIKVDLVAGTSAGGLNGALLATAIASGEDMPDMRTAWLELADLHKLAVHNNPAIIPSLLNGDYFSEHVTSLIGAGKNASASMPVADNRADVGRLLPRDCALLLTATAIGSKPLYASIEGGRSAYLDSRRVYRFDRIGAPDGIADASERNDFNDRTTVALAARASASYPIAFDPVRESQSLASRRVGSMPVRNAEQSWLMDGGVLDNAPFEPLLDALFDRPIDRPFDRVLLYVTPGVEAAYPSDDLTEKPKLPGTLRAILGAAREPDQRLDHNALAKVFELMGYSQSQPFRVIAEYLRQPASPAIENYKAAAIRVLDRYRAGGAEALTRQLAATSGLNVAQWQPPILAVASLNDIPALAFTFPVADARDWRFGIAAADRVLRWWGRALSELASDSTEAIGQAFSAIDRSQRIVTDMSRRRDERVTAASGEALSLERQMLALGEFYGDVSNTGQLTEAMYSAAERIVTAFPDVDVDVDTLLAVSTSIEVLSSLHGWHGGDYDVPTFRYRNVTPAVKPLVDLEGLADGNWPRKKLYGQRWGNFGAFASSEGRAHDWLWGRLDGAAELSAEVLADSGIPSETIVQLRMKLIEAILAAENVTTEQLIAGATQVRGVTAAELLATLQAQGSQTLGRLQRSAISMLGEFDGGSSLPVGKYLQASLADRQTWQAVRGELRWRDRLSRTMLRAYTAPLRRKLRIQLKKATKSGT